MPLGTFHSEAFIRYTRLNAPFRDVQSLFAVQRSRCGKSHQLGNEKRASSDG